jgi:hypothetical protein
MKLVPPEKLPNIAAAKVMFYVHQERIKDAKTEFENLLRQGIPLEKDMAVVSEMIQNT